MGKGNLIGAMATGALAFALSGCGLPPAITAASWALDGVSYVATGKSVTDHAISEVSQRDCALFRVVQDREICHDFATGDTTLLASLETEVFEDGDRTTADDSGRAFAFGPRPAPREAVAVSRSDAAAGEVRQAAWTGADDPVVVPREEAWLAAALPGTVRAVSTDAPAPADTLLPASSPQPAHAAPRDLAALDAPLPDAGFGRWAEPVERPADVMAPVRTADAGALARLGRTNAAVVGSFADRANAVALAARLDDLGARVLAADVGGRAFHRVVVDAPVGTLRDRGYADAWTVHLCTGTGALPPCAPAGRAMVELASAG